MKRSCKNCETERHCWDKGQLCSRWRRRHADRLEHQIEEYIRWTSKREKIDVPQYRAQAISSSSSGSFITFILHDDVAPNAFIIVESPNKEDWRKFKFKIVTDDPRVAPIVQPIIDQYVEDMFQYYLDCEQDEAEDKEARIAKEAEKMKEKS